MRVADEAGAVVVRISSHELENPCLLEDAFEHLIEQLRHRTLIVDLSAVETITSLGIAVLIAAHGLALIHQTRVVLTCVCDKVRRPLEVVGADQIITMRESVDSALSALTT